MIEKHYIQAPVPEIEVDAPARAAAEASDPNATGPEWGYEDPVEPMFAEEAPTVEQRQAAQDCASRLGSYIQPYLRSGGVPVSPDEIQGLYEGYQQERLRSEGPAFPRFTLTHLRGATQRMTAWFEDLHAHTQYAGYRSDADEYRALGELVGMALDQTQAPGAPAGPSDPSAGAL